jgi:hypothetical protein
MIMFRYLCPGSQAQESKHFASQRLPLVVIRHVHHFMPGELCNLLSEIYFRAMPPPSRADLEQAPMLPKLLLEGDLLCETITCNDVRAALEDLPEGAFLRLHNTPQLAGMPAYRFWQRMQHPPDDPLPQCPMLEMLYEQLGKSVEVCLELPINCHVVPHNRIDRIVGWRHQSQPLGIIMTAQSYFTREQLYLLWQRDQHLFIQAPSLEHVLSWHPFSQHKVY